jgi:hypothetical protein
MYKAGLVSVVIPTFNRPEMMAYAVQSVQAQHYSNLQIVIVDDASEGPTEEAVHRLMATDSRIHNHRLPENQGHIRAKEIGSTFAEGEFLQFLDDDDVIHPQKLSIQVQMLEEDPSLDLVACQTLHFNHSVGDTDKIWNTMRGGDAHVVRFLSHNHLWGSEAPLWRTERLHELGGHGSPRPVRWEENRRAYEDFEHSALMLINGIRAEFHNQLLAFHRTHFGQRISIASEQQRTVEHLKVFENISRHLRANQPQMQDVTAIRHSFLWLMWRLIHAGRNQDAEVALNLAKQWVESDGDSTRLDSLFERQQQVDSAEGRSILEAAGIDVEMRQGWWRTFRVGQEPIVEIPRQSRYRRS